jgi:hypothetical protein
MGLRDDNNSNADDGEPEGENMGLRDDNNSNADGGDLDALKQISQLEGDPLIRDFLTVVFNYELDKGEDAMFPYMESYRRVVEGIVEKKSRGK